MPPVATFSSSWYRPTAVRCFFSIRVAMGEYRGWCVRPHGRRSPGSSSLGDGGGGPVGPPVERGRPPPEPLVVDLPGQLRVDVLDVVLVHRGFHHPRPGPLLVPRQVEPGGDLLQALLRVD